MDKCHVSQEIEDAINKMVKITFFDGTTETGILRHNEWGRGYALVRSEGDLGFYKTHIKKIEVLN